METVIRYERMFQEEQESVEWNMTRAYTVRHVWSIIEFLE